MLYAADAAWWTVRAQDALRFPGLKVTAQADCVFPDVKLLRVTGIEGFDEDPGAIRTGNNSGYQALHIAVHAGASRIHLFGFDMGGEHWHGPHPKELRQTNPATYAKWIARFEALAPILAPRGVDVVNHSPASALRCFRFAAADELEPVGA